MLQQVPSLLVLLLHSLLLPVPLWRPLLLPLLLAVCVLLPASHELLAAWLLCLCPQQLSLLQQPEPHLHLLHPAASLAPRPHHMLLVPLLVLRQHHVQAEAHHQVWLQPCQQQVAALGCLPHHTAAVPDHPALCPASPPLAASPGILPAAHRTSALGSAAWAAAAAVHGLPPMAAVLLDLLRAAACCWGALRTA